MTLEEFNYTYANKKLICPKYRYGYIIIGAVDDLGSLDNRVNGGYVFYIKMTLNHFDDPNFQARWDYDLNDIRCISFDSGNAINMFKECEFFHECKDPWFLNKE